ncbi:MAG: hypothetical protein ACR2KK_01315 [Acidimicrobiales bacterium]
MNARTLIRRALAGTALAVMATPAVAGAQSQVRPLVVARGPLVDYSTPTSESTDGASAYLVSAVRGHRTDVVLFVTGLKAASGEDFGAHAHVGPCVENAPTAAGPHYRGPGAPVDDEHEVWLDFIVLPGGIGVARTSVPFVIPDGAARSVVIHRDSTASDGSAGPRLACLPVAF